MCTGDKKNIGLYRVPEYLGKLTTRGVQYGYNLYSLFLPVSLAESLALVVHRLQYDDD
jgi:hypothetical protein